MEIILTSLAILTLLVLIILVGTRGRPMRFFTAFGESMRGAAANWQAITLTTICCVLVLAFLYFFYMSPATVIGVEQPIPFSHRLHPGHKAIQCEFCHPYVSYSNHPGLPPVEKCLYCHNYIIANHPQILKEHRYYDTNTPTPWREVFYLSEHVLFNHQRHIKKEIACKECHGVVEAQDRLKGHRFKMGFCIKCHRRMEANIDCWLACHS